MATFLGENFMRVRGALPHSVRDMIEMFLVRGSILNTSGWLRSRRDGLPVDAEGNPIPWYTYPAIRFLEPRVRPEFSVFEYGAGNSTLWWAKRVAEVMSFEHSREWFDRISGSAPANASIQCPEDYISAPVGQFDVIVIDGIERPECARAALPALKPDGVFIWDNSEEEPDFACLPGFRRLDFWGFGPMLANEWCTSVLYRDDNCLGI